VAQVITEDYLDPVHTVQTMQELLDAKYLWIEDEEDDELGWEEETPKGYEQQAFLGHYYFSHLLLQEALPIFTAINAHNKEAAKDLDELITILKQHDK